jgi:hypothetical protein
MRVVGSALEDAAQEGRNENKHKNNNKDDKDSILFFIN